MKKPVILSIYCRHKPGGFTKRLYRAYQAIATAGYELTYIAAEALPVQGPGIKPVLLPMRSKPGSFFYWPEFYLRAIWVMRQLTKQENVQTHFVFSFFYATISIFSSITLPVRTITLVRGDDVYDAGHKKYPTLRKLVHQVIEQVGARFSAQILATNNSMAQAIARRTGQTQKITVLPNDITTRPLAIELPQADKTVNIVTVSVLNPRKNILLVLQALAPLKHLDWHYRLIGGDSTGGRYLKELIAYTEAAGINQRVSFLGWQDDIAQHIRNSHLFVFPTLMEGSPNALMEAMGYGIPCLGSRIPEITEVLTDAALTFPPEYADELTNKLQRFMAEPEYAQQIAAKTKRYKEQYLFDWDQAIVELVNTNNLQAAAYS